MEARVGAQGVEPRVYSEVGHVYVAVFIGFFQPFKGFVLFAKADVDRRHMIRVRSWMWGKQLKRIL